MCFVTHLLFPSADSFGGVFAASLSVLFAVVGSFLTLFGVFGGHFSGPCWGYFRSLIFDTFLSDSLCRVFTASLSAFGFCVFFGVFSGPFSGPFCCFWLFCATFVAFFGFWSLLFLVLTIWN